LWVILDLFFAISCEFWEIRQKAGKSSRKDRSSQLQAEAAKSSQSNQSQVRKSSQWRS